MISQLSMTFNELITVFPKIFVNRRTIISYIFVNIVHGIDQAVFFEITSSHSIFNLYQQMVITLVSISKF